MSKDENAPGMSSKEKFILVSIVMGTFMAALDVTIVAVALPTIAKSFSTIGSTTEVSWILLGYTLSLCCFILLWGKLGSNIGYKKMFILGVVIFTAMSLLVGLAGISSRATLTDIIILRMIQGLGAGMISAMGLAMISSYLPNSKGMAVGMITLAASAGTAFGPALGGVLCYFHWSYIFFINVPIGIICVVMSLKSMSNVKEIREEKQRLDVIGVILMIIMMFSIIYYLNSGRSIGWTSDEGLLLIVLAFIPAGLLVWWEQRVKNPLISVRLMKIKDVVEGNLVAAILFAGMAGSYLLLPYYLEYCQGYSTVEMGLILIANSLGMIVVGPMVGRISDRTGINNRAVSLGCLVAALGFFMLALLRADSSLWYILLALFIMGMGIGIALVASTNLCLSYSDDGEDGQMSGLINTFRQAGSSAGVAILEAVFAGAIVVPLIIDPSNLSWLMTGFRPAFFVATVFALIAFVISMFVRDKKVREVM
ncbi:MAG: DHA2 family efflux MFS transporter permease subunit [Candidatus Methanomethylophilaceae archaeon]|nr:DHA2 family efflux MFS transporter permease subunit [Candidatus Methanomethylophilaceae archaeon]MDD3379224.1 DHA2 family efflux MFS transporter permease subunit [Candidatus Methanomethylophilaceae archaeon]MDY0224502.1 DHA2 family efflux MFS transporter permease subunit [Candidatus Methanomethylophilaceae archaeon]